MIKESQVQDRTVSLFFNIKFKATKTYTHSDVGQLQNY